ncbi:hypothetical protein J6590_077745 [Homalodisca vitripennis]|nr:hypothetical protein J6590_077745 [Homalodisca vitripennis]
MSWPAVSYGILLIYHFILLQALGIPAQVNLNHMLCPAVKDPFAGPYYRMYAIVHQAILIPLLSKSIPALVYQFSVKSHQPCSVTASPSELEPHAVSCCEGPVCRTLLSHVRHRTSGHSRPVVEQVHPCIGLPVLEEVSSVMNVADTTTN